jgi:hypothetical protein
MEPALSEVEGAGIFDFDLTNQGQIKIKIPTLPQRTWQGWGTRFENFQKNKSRQLFADG